jgi:hypothetical protein
MGNRSALGMRGQLMDRGPDTVPVAGRPLASSGPVHAMALLVDALAERDFRRADNARKELRRRGFEVKPLNTPRKAVGR